MCLPGFLLSNGYAASPDRAGLELSSGADGFRLMRMFTIDTTLVVG